MRILIVHAHHEPTSFNGSLTREAVAALSADAHEVVVSDLYAMGFDAVSEAPAIATLWTAAGAVSPRRAAPNLDAGAAGRPVGECRAAAVCCRPCYAARLLPRTVAA